MSGPTAGRVTSADGTTIAFDRSGAGPGIILVHGALTDRAHPVLQDVAAALAPCFTVFNYDRRGRGGSQDTAPYAVEREIEDLAALIEVAGGSAMVFGGSSGAGLALAAAARNPAITRLALWEPPYHVDSSAPELPDDFAARLETLISAGRPADAVELFMVEATDAPAGVVAGVVAAMRRQPGWSAAAVAHTLPYEAAVMGPGNVLPAGRLAGITQPTLVLTGGASPAWLRTREALLPEPARARLTASLTASCTTFPLRRWPRSCWSSSPPEPGGRLLRAWPHGPDLLTGRRSCHHPTAVDADRLPGDE